MIEIYVLTDFEQTKMIRNIHKEISCYAINANAVYNAAEITKMRLSAENEIESKGTARLCVYGFSEEIQKQIEEIKNAYNQKLSLYICERKRVRDNVGTTKKKSKNNMSNAILYFNRIEELHFIEI